MVWEFAIAAEAVAKPTKTQIDVEMTLTLNTTITKALVIMMIGDLQQIVPVGKRLCAITLEVSRDGNFNLVRCHLSIIGNWVEDELEPR